MAKNGRDEDRFDLMEEFKGELKLNKNELDEHLLRQPVLFHRIADLHARAQADLSEQKQGLKKLEATIAEKVREQAEADGVRATKDYVDSKVILSPEMDRATTQYSKTERRVFELVALKEAYRERSYSIRGLIDLYVANYFQAESGGERRRDAVEDAANRNREASGRLRREKRRRVQE